MFHYSNMPPMLYRVFSLLALALFSFPAFANVGAGLMLNTGVDVWGAPARQVRYLPNYSTDHKWDNLGGWARLEGSVGDKTTQLYGNVKFSEANGARIMALNGRVFLPDYKMHIDAGIVPYKVSWCRDQDENQFITEPDPFCRFSGLAEMSTSGTGVQVYKTGFIGSWLVDGMAGVYKPSIDGQDKKLAIYVPVGPNTRHDKVGASVSAINLSNASLLRASWLRTWQDQHSDDPKSYDRSLRYDTGFIGADVNLASSVALKGTVSAYVGDQTNLANPYKFRAISVSSELQWKPSPAHEFSLGVNRYANRTIYAKTPTKHQWVAVPSVSVAYRRNLSTDAFIVVQATRSFDKTITKDGVVTEKMGTAYGVRISRRFPIL